MMKSRFTWPSRGAAFLAVVLLVRCPLGSQTLPATQATATPAPRAAALPGATERRRVLEARQRHLRTGRLLPHHRQLHVERARGRAAVHDAARAGVKGGVYIGVGPSRTSRTSRRSGRRWRSSSTSGVRPSMQHLMFKAVFEMAPDRADFISLLFSKPRPAGLDETTSDPADLGRVPPVADRRALAARTTPRIVERLTKTHGFTFTRRGIDQLGGARAFVGYGPSISTRGGAGGRAATA